MSSDLNFQSTFKLSTGYEIPRLGFGVAYGFGKNEDTSVVTVPSVLEALKVGYTHFDTAQMYENEKEVGDAIRKSGVDRSKLFITSKVPEDGGAPHESVDKSLKALGFEYIDLYLIHSPPSGTENRLAKWKSLIEAKTAGKVRSIGVSNYNVHHLEEIKNAGLELPSVNQIEIHPFCQQRPIVEYCKANGIVVEAYCPVIRGKLDHPLIVELAEKYKRDPAQILLRWSLQQGLVPLVRSSQPQRIASNAALYDFVLEKEDETKLTALDQGAKGAISWNPVDVA
ncbi:Aldo/keto reductase [Abortiporus biennis]|nr:Aldo/keto reductase [Abortiporus biennis]